MINLTAGCYFRTENKGHCSNTLVMGLHGQILVAVETTRVTSVRSCQRLSLCVAEPRTAICEMELCWPRPSQSDQVVVPHDNIFKKEKKLLCKKNLAQRRGK